MVPAKPALGHTVGHTGQGAGEGKTPGPMPTKPALGHAVGHAGQGVGEGKTPGPTQELKVSGTNKKKGRRKQGSTLGRDCLVL